MSVNKQQQLFKDKLKINVFTSDITTTAKVIDALWDMNDNVAKDFAKLDLSELFRENSIIYLG